MGGQYQALPFSYPARATPWVDPAENRMSGLNVQHPGTQVRVDRDQGVGAWAGHKDRRSSGRYLLTTDLKVCSAISNDGFK